MKVKLLFPFLVVTVSLILTASSISLVAASHFCHQTYPQYAYLGGPAIASADNGDTIEMQTNGLIWIAWNPIEGSGSFVHKDPDGNVVRSGTWTVEKLQIFKPYGCDEENDWDLGGRMQLKIHLVTTEGSEYTGWLEIENPTGHNAPANAVEGIRLKVGAWGLNFSQPIWGYTGFGLV